MKKPICLTECTVPLLIVALGCRPDAGVIEPDTRWDRVGVTLASAEYSQWSAPVNLGSVVNSTANDLAAEMSKDGLSLYFASNRAGGFGANDIYVSRRATVDDPWGTPVNLGPVINTAFGDAGPHLSRDGHLLFFTSGRPGFGANDIWVSRRTNTNDDFGWETPVNLGPPVNTADSELGPNLRRPEFYFWRGPGTAGDIYVSRMNGDDFDVPVAIAELNSPGHDEKPSIRFDGHEIYLASNRDGGVGDLDLWVSTRKSNGDAWESPVNLGLTINTTSQDRRPALSTDGTMLFFDSNRPGGVGNLDLYVTTRTRGGQSPVKAPNVAPGAAPSAAKAARTADRTAANPATGSRGDR